MLNPAKRQLRFLIKRADAARDEGRHAAAAALYEEALRLHPAHAGVHIQRGHMLKELGALEQAGQHYAAAERLRPDDADLALQLGHFHKVAGDPHAATRAYARALALRPGWADAARELGWMEEAAARVRVLPADPVEFAIGHGGDADAFEGLSAAEVARLVPGLAPRRRDDLLLSHGEEIAIRRFGRRETSFWGNRITLRGVEGLRGFCVSELPIVEAEVILGGLRIHRGPVKGGYPLKLERDPARIKKYVFNLWIDFSSYPHGLHTVELRLLDASGGTRSAYEEVVLAEPIPEEAFPDSNFLVSISHDDPRPIDEQIRDKPSMLRPARRALFPDGVRNLLVLRTDQLGDMVASVPALRRLREIVPDAGIVGLMTPANAELARTLGLLDEVIVIDFPDDPTERRRVMPLRAQQALRERLAPYAFDVALDLAQAPVSRDLLRLAEAKFSFGTGGEDWPWLSSDFLFHTRDRWTRHDFTPHSTKVMGLVEALGALLKTAAPIIRRPELSRAMLDTYGVAPSERYAVLHTGARIGFSQWPYYSDLATMLLAATDLKIVIITEDPSFRATMPAELLEHDRIVFLEGRLPFDHFDAFLSFATVMVGNDSGPKHLASLRGTNVVTIFSARINWTEWGQENVGAIISRKLPCAGCALLHDAEECGRDFVCITDIKAHEVFDAMMVYVNDTGAV